MPRRAGALAALLLLAAPALADENSDLDLIPPSVETAPTPPQSAETKPAGRLFLENALTANGLRGNLAVAYPPPAPTTVQNRTSLDGAWQWNLGSGFSAAFSDRLNLFEASGERFGDGQTARNDLREATVTYEPVDRLYLEAGRINLRQGVALGFNPTDFFRPRTAVDDASLDPSVLQQDRLGTVMLHAQRVGDGWTAAFAYAPELARPAPLIGNTGAPLDPQLGRTNGDDRMLATLSANLLDLAPELLLFEEHGQSRIGLDISHPIGRSIVAYAEWSGGVQRNLIADAYDFGRETGTIPAGAPMLPASDRTLRFRNQLAAGFSWTSETRVTLNLEYHLDEAALTPAEWSNWLAGSAGGRNADALLWFLRGYVNDQGSPLARQQLFGRLDWTDAFVRGLELSAIAFVNLRDESSLVQVTASYDFNRTWTAALYLAAFLGARSSEYGTLPTGESATLRIARYF